VSGAVLRYGVHRLTLRSRGALACCGAALLASCSTVTPAPGGSASAAGAASSAGGASGTAGGNAGNGRSADALLLARIRRLANAEYDASVHALLATEQRPASGPDFPPDLRQEGFTVNDKQRVDAVIVERLADAAEALATEAKQNGTLARLAPCAEGADRTRCAQAFIGTFGKKAYRRPLLDDESIDLLKLYAVGADGASYLDGIAHVTRGLLQSAGFLYLTELGNGEPASDGTVPLTPYELAAALSYFLTSAPPDEQLLAQATSGALSEPAERQAQARRLFATDPAAKDTVVRLVREWLGIDRIAQSSKDSRIYPAFDSVKPQIVAESTDFVRAVAFESTGNVSELLGAHWTVNSGPLSLYQTAGSGPVTGRTLLTDRVGILNQAAFLTTYAAAHESHPIFRGVAIARRVTCYKLDSPASFNLQVVPPAPDPTLTTRERFSAHVRDPLCASCHDVIDPYGFSFEQFDGIGAYREVENGKRVDSSVVVAVGADFDGAFADSNQLASALAESPAVRECFARLMFRAATGTGDWAATPGESEFVDLWRSISAAAQGGIVETLIAYVSRPAFGLRAAP